MAATRQRCDDGGNHALLSLRPSMKIPEMDKQVFLSSYLIDGDILVIKLRGKLDDQMIHQFNEEIERQFAAGIHKIIVDCAHLGYVSSYGIGALVRAQVKLRRQGGEMKLAAIQSVVADIFRIVRLDKLLDIHGDIEFARESFYKS